jgi:NADPH:quinone reductase-like Zn-dependent oxidoreductase
VKAVAVFPGKPGSAYLTDLAEPSIDDVPSGRGVLVRVIRVGLDGTEFAPGDYVVARVRRAGTSLHDTIDSPDFTTDDSYVEHGISRVHGFLTERYVEQPRYLVKIPPALRDVGVLLEPLSLLTASGVIKAYIEIGD